MWAWQERDLWAGQERDMRAGQERGLTVVLRVVVEEVGMAGYMEVVDLEC